MARTEAGHPHTHTHLSTVLVGNSIPHSVGTDIGEALSRYPGGQTPQDSAAPLPTSSDPTFQLMDPVLGSRHGGPGCLRTYHLPGMAGVLPALPLPGAALGTSPDNSFNPHNKPQQQDTER